MPTDSKRKNDPEGLKKRILSGALTVFAEFGMQGARLEQIASEAATTKRMVVYHFQNKEQLYIAVLEKVYEQIRQYELGLNLSKLPPKEALITLVEKSFDYHISHADFMRLVCCENLLRGRYISQSSQIQSANQTALEVLENILSRGKSNGDFYTDLNVIDVHRLISSICVHQVSNRYTFNALFHSQQSNEEILARNRQLAVTAVVRYVCVK
ncbi:TetR family transcriptional regulator [Hafnia paralvei]|jgi:AcrR family transcriptional regulator|uniref:TetR family transcriptional regulator n=1 Tax=Hafnia paralvei TaxID=546367 RepID=UPI0015857AE7|nr:TetR family transcriptional regulator [Hafnia paralvei]MBU2671604.1 TetR family transcriptional regulator [Hafnia paralvei]MCE9909254.1 TetR family transcriptional regulator [Hafnia paralvei]MCE9910634.1 TetR family transcriptional regulator [Hafnia paralvei]MCK2181904.1 TetR family transcriptional regulator [Hafnia paralvei]MDX6909565.1 TetR family transcriptional regulator [Hafnia paralvei]